MTTPQAQPLTADLCATAIVAAARHLGDDPILAFTTPRLRGGGTAQKRRALLPAALALVETTGWTRARVCEVVGADKFAMGKVQERFAGSYCAALAALAAVRGTDVAPPPVGEKPKRPYVRRAVATPAAVSAPPTPVASAPVTPAPPVRVDHTDAIRAALARRAASAGADQLTVSPPPAQSGALACGWPMGEPGTADFRICCADAVVGRPYCATHQKAAGLQTTPKVIETVGRVARSYTDREAG